MHVRRETVLPAGVERVWQALTDDRQLSTWFGGEVNLDPRRHALAEFRGPGGVRRARVERVERDRCLSWSWLDGDDEEDGHVELFLAEAAEGTRLTVTETATTASAEMSWMLRLDALACSVGARAGVAGALV